MGGAGRRVDAAGALARRTGDEPTVTLASIAISSLLLLSAWRSYCESHLLLFYRSSSVLRIGRRSVASADHVAADDKSFDTKLDEPLAAPESTATGEPNVSESMPERKGTTNTLMAGGSVVDGNSHRGRKGRRDDQGGGERSAC